MPSLVGTALGDASGTALEDASSAALGEPDTPVYVAYGGFMLGTASPIPWEELNNFLRALKDAIDLGEGFVSTAVLANITNGIEEIIEKVDGVQATVDTTDDHVLNIADDGVNSLQTVLDAIGAIEGGGLTTEEHDHLFTLDPAATIANNVWQWEIEGFHQDGVQRDSPAALWLTAIGQEAVWNATHEGYPIAQSAFWRVYGTWNSVQQFAWRLYDDPQTWYLPADPDFTAVEEGDTLLSFLTREYPTISWGTVPAPNLLSGSRPAYQLNSDGLDVWIGPRFDLPQLAATHADMTVSEGFAADVVAPPVWPGSDAVTEGSPVALADQLHVVGTMHGVLVNVTTPPTKLGRRSIGGATYDYSVGEIAFETDSGELEPWQYLGFRSAIFVPKTMTVAAGARFRVLGGAEGTVTPWVRT